MYNLSDFKKWIPVKEGGIRDSTNGILNAWILMEQLSEGELKTSSKDKNSPKVFYLQNSKKYGIYNYLRWCLNQKYKDCLNKKSSNAGIVFYLECFNFKKIIELIVRENNMEKSFTENEFDKEKFGIAIAFDKDLNYLPDYTFVTMSYYFLEKGKLFESKNIISEFKEFEKKIKNIFEAIFTKENPDEEVFNDEFDQLTDCFDFGTNNTYWQLVENIYSAQANLHSFFLSDLEYAKKHDSGSIERYLHGIDAKQRINLDPAKNIESFVSTLQPLQYPKAHFLSRYFPSLMQQVAINLALNDKNDIRTVNGPPGTGKTTLLGDIFANLLVEQAKEICQLPNKYISTKKVLTPLPEQIANKNIVVASSNNSAVRNIIDDLNKIPKSDDIFNEIEDELHNLHYFDEIANFEKVTDTKQNKNYWGLLSLEGGKKSNLKNIEEKVKKIVESFKNDETSPDEDAYVDFERQYQKVATRQLELQEYREKIEDRKRRIGYLENRIENWKEKVQEYHIEMNSRGDVIFSSDLHVQLKKTKENIEVAQRNYDVKKSLLQLIPSPKSNWFTRIFKRKQIKAAELDFAEKIKQATTEMCKANDELNEQVEIKQSLEKKLETIQQLAKENFKNKVELSNLYQICQDNQLDSIPNFNLDFSKSENYIKFENAHFWYNKDDLKEEIRLFLMALRVRKQFMYENRESLYEALKNWKNRYQIFREDQGTLNSWSWEWINFAIPIISTTFASFYSMFKYLPSSSIANLFIDEAGQATPQSVIGPLLNCQKIMAVGDPAQIKPVNTLGKEVTSLIRKIFNVSEKYISEDASVQALMDQASVYGYYKDNSEKNWIGIPLWVHRRCLNPMFSISNGVSYNNRMVLPLENKGLGQAEWINVSGKSSNKYVKEQTEALINRIEKLPVSYKKEDIFIITPFKNVAYKLKIELKKIGIPGRNIGTVHTFQGKENEIVFLVLGASNEEKGAAYWAVSEPNIINVAATRAKKRFYIIGDKKLYSGLGTDTVQKVLKVLAKFNYHM